MDYSEYVFTVQEDSQGVIDMSDGRDDIHSDIDDDGDSHSIRSKRGK